MLDNVFVWFATLGNLYVLSAFAQAGFSKTFPLNPPKLMLFKDEDTNQIVVSAEGTDERVVFDDDFGWLWYNAAGPEAA